MRICSRICAAAAILLAAGCSDSSFLTGRYCSTTRVSVPGAEGFENEFVAIEMAQYGPDIGGIVSLHWLDMCSDELDVSNRCPCGVICGGVFNDGRVEFTFTYRETNCAQTEGVKIKVTLEPGKDEDGGDILTGRLDSTDDVSPPTESLTFKRLVTEKDFEKMDVSRRSCEKLLGEKGCG